MIRRPAGPLPVAIVDGNALSAKLISRLLGELVECKIVCYPTAESALRGVATALPELVLTEWSLPGSNGGGEFIRRLRSVGKMGNVPIIAIADEEDSDIEIEARAAAVSHVFFRPINRIKLQELLALVVGQQHTDLITAVTNPMVYEVELQLKQVDKLAPLPAVVAGILEITGDPNSTARRLAEVIQTDQALTAKILQIVNSAYYGFHREIGNIDHAVVILGYDEVVNVALAACIIQTYSGDHNPYFNMNQFWLHSLASAYVARSLRVFVPEIISKDAFVVGLLHDLGKVVLYQHFRESFLQTIVSAAEENKPLQQVAMELESPDHAEVGAMVADTWNLPEPLVRAIRLHHTPQLAGKHDYAVHMAHLANFFAHWKKLGSSGNPVPDAPNPDSLSVFGLEGTDYEAMWAVLKVDVNAIERLHSSYIAG